MSKDPREEELSALRARVVGLEESGRRARERARAAELEHGLLRAAFAKAPIGLGIADGEGEFLVWNDAMPAVSGFSPSEEARWKEVRASEAARASRKSMLEVLRAQGMISAQHIRIPRIDGTTSDAVLTATPVEVTGDRFWHVTMQDVTELKRVEQALRESELRFRQVAETVRQVFYITTPGFEQVLYVSPAYEEQWGRTCESLYTAPQSWIDAIHPDDRPRVEEQLARGPVERRFVLEYRIVRSDGSIRWISDKAFELLDANGAPYRIVGVADDLTERRGLEEQLREVQKMEAVGQLAGGVAHDFNNLLTTILANVSLLRRKAGDGDERRDLLADVELAANRGAELTKKLLGFSRRAVLTLEPLDLRVTVRETAALLRHTLDPRVRFVIDEADELGKVLADAGEMSQVLLNLCLNGRDAMPDGGRLLVRTRGCVVSQEHARLNIDARPGDAVCLTVEDTGHGISPEVRGRIFEPFFTSKQHGSGTGLGLAMVFGIVKQHKGWIEFTSEVGRGTRFDVYLPRHEGPGAPTRVSEPSSPRATAAETILFVDDEEPLRRVAKAILADRGYRVLTAEDGVAAVAIYERERHSIDLVVLDLRMPRLSGRDTLRAIWRLRPDAKVLVSSGHAAEHDGVAQTEPVAGSLHKPYGYDELTRAVRAALDA